jgi:predicted DsbA family dithiol-disulfide isomerase
VWSDFVCPWCYIGLAELNAVRKAREIEMHLEPYLLRPDAPETGWALPANIRAKMGAADNPLQVRAKALGLVLKERDHVPSSRRAHECAEVARTQGKGEAFHTAVLKLYWTEGKDLHEWDTLEEAARAAGVDGGAMRAAVETGKPAAVVKDKLEAATELGIQAVPTFVIANKYLVQGAQTRDVFERILG